jgi:hypothetical protein
VTRQAESFLFGLLCLTGAVVLFLAGMYLLESVRWG